MCQDIQTSHKQPFVTFNQKGYLKHNPCVNYKFGRRFQVCLNAMQQSWFVLLFLIPLYPCNHRCSRLLIINYHILNKLRINTATHTMKRIRKRHLVQNVPNAFYFFNLYFFRVKTSTLYLQRGFTHILKILFQNI